MLGIQKEDPPPLGKSHTPNALYLTAHVVSMSSPVVLPAPSM